MKKLFVLLILASCNSPEQLENEQKNLDSLIQVSDEQIHCAEKSAKHLDSVTTETIEKTTEKVNEMTNELDSYKSQMTKIKKTEKIVYRVDTVFIEKKKNFWGREKTKVNVSSDSSIDVTTDTTENE